MKNKSHQTCLMGHGEEDEDSNGKKEPGFPEAGDPNGLRAAGDLAVKRIVSQGVPKEIVWGI